MFSIKKKINTGNLKKSFPKSLHISFSTVKDVRKVLMFSINILPEEFVTILL